MFNKGDLEEENMNFPKCFSFLLDMLLMSKTFYFHLQISYVLEVELTYKIICKIKMCLKNFINNVSIMTLQ